MSDTVAVRAARLAAGHYNSDDVSPANPGGLGDDGHAANLPALLEDVGVVAQQVGLDAAAAISAADEAGGARAAVVELLGQATVANGVAVAARDVAVAAAAALRSLPVTKRDGATAHVLTTSGATVPVILRDGTTVSVQLT